LKTKQYLLFLWNTDCHFLSQSSWSDKRRVYFETNKENYVVENINKKNINTAVVSPISQDTWYDEAFGIVYGFMAVNVPIY
jgi:hypothetical protein